jgi:SAM-dependent methyltransferase
MSFARLLFGTTIFVAATLLFVVQPMVARALLPALGGSSAVWTTCMLFFQVALLAGYAWAHGGTARLPLKGLVAAHLAFAALAGLTLPLSLASDVEAANAPVSWVLRTLTIAVGPTFIALAATSPLLQAWYARLGEPDSDDPYYLYAASNLGSMLALLAYPLAIEPFLGVGAQLTTWSVGFAVLVVGLASCGALTWRRGTPIARRSETSNDSDTPATKAHMPSATSVSAVRIGTWIGLAFVPSSLMLGATSHITTDLAPVPLLWVLPLAAYLGSFIIVFARRAWRIPVRVQPLFPPAILMLVALEGFDAPMAFVVGAHLVAFAAIALLFHGWLADARPEASRLTSFYLAMSVGGALGGLFNGLIAPSVFDRNVDYLFVLAIAAAVVPVARRQLDPLRPRSGALAALLGAGAFYLWSVGALPWPPFRSAERTFEWVVALGGLGIAFSLSYWRARLHHLAFAIVFLVGGWSILHTPGAVRYDRSFYATYKVFDRTYRGLHVRKFSHGTTSHGAQYLDPDLRRTPTAYHHPSGPVGQVVERFGHDRVAVVGLGIGAMAAYPRGSERWDFFEIDPLVVTIANEDFAYLDDCGERCAVQVGDGRLLLAERPDDHYDIIFLDAYNSDSVPAHLLTVEALELYSQKLAPGGIIVFHVSNRYIDVEGVVGALAEHAGLAARTQVHYPTADQRRLQVRTSAYVVVAEDEKTLAPIVGDERWNVTDALDKPWTDDNSNIVGALKL